jgi:biotin carboxyl carrier protein
MSHAFQLGATLHEVQLSRTRDAYVLHHADATTPVHLRQNSPVDHILQLGNNTLPVVMCVDGDHIHLHIEGRTHTLTHRHPLDRLAQAGGAASESDARAPMPGAVISLAVTEGQSVRRGDVLLVIESMKMETTLVAGVDGTVSAVHVQVGQTFERDAILVTVHPQEDAA